MHPETKVASIIRISETYAMKGGWVSISVVWVALMSITVKYAVTRSPRNIEFQQILTGVKGL